MTETVKMDRELVRAVRDAIAADVEKFEMATWFSGPGCYTEVPAAKRLDVCGTTGCLAGYAVVEYAKLHNTAWRVYGDFVKLPLLARRDAVANVARRLLSGGPDTQSNEAWMALFNIVGWPQHYQDMVVAGANSHEAQAKAVIELLDDIRDEITVWRETLMPKAPCTPGCEICTRWYVACTPGRGICTRWYVVKGWVYLPDEVPAEGA